MATFLYRLGRFSFRRRRLVALLWVAVLAACAFAAAKAPTAPEDGFSMPGTESQKAFDLLDQRFPGGNSKAADARIVFVAPKGQKVTAGPNKAAVEKIVTDVAGGSQVKGALNPFEMAGAVSKDGTTAYSTVSYDVQSTDLTDATTKALEDAAENGRDAGLTVELGGSALVPKGELGGTTELIGVAAAAVVLLITFGSLAAAGLPLLTAIVGIGVGVASIVAIGMSTTTTTLALMLGLAVGIDYALFIVSRYRTERAEGHSAEEAAARAVGTAGSAVVFAGLTVVIALAGLAVVGIPVLTRMGLAAAGTVVIAVLVAMTLLPALLGFFQKAVLPRTQRKARGGQRAKDDRPNMGTRWARFVIRRPLAVLVLGILGLGLISVPALDLRLGMPGDESKPTSTTQRRAYDALAHGFGPGFNGPLTVVVDAKGSDDPKAAAARAAKELSTTDGIVAVTPPAFNKAGDTAVLTAVPATGPSTADTTDLVRTIRDEAHGLESETGATMLVTGTTAVNIDVSQKVTDALVPYLALVVGLAFLLLMIVFRSLLVPLKAALGFLLSVTAAFGTIVAVFQWGWLADALGVEQTGPVMSMMPIFLIGVVFGLAMDYEVFLVTRMREAYVHGERPGEAIVTGFRHSARVVGAAAVIMIAVFAGFIGMSESMIKMMGLGLASAVFFDAFIVRMAVVPAVLALLGDRAWWLPGWLGKVVPRVDVEGEKLTRGAPAAPAPTAEPDPDPVRV
ncbi:MMPL family transporter [Streptomyces sp. Ncost-T10-10d]|uniref:MMPL family transporter n=1 Tax=Streptomyces sp. Ncost-T10-10d TaxID=1839774 RepID=UPI00081E42C9|nr:MMPL family transporter [Streptomyces sp. Ncost-T10-10d]SCF91003.1 putative drug exporter of the RND superfamily [Streptomyces sp. Ncost-T10-10d]